MTAHVLESMNEVITNNYDSDHKAIDIVASDKKETNIIALDGGRVNKVVNHVKGTNHQSQGLATYGNYVKVKQDNGKTALYAHMKYGSVKVKEGEYIEKGTVIGSMGETGNAYGKHLHLEIQNENNVKENPIVYLNNTSTTKNTNVQKENKTIENHTNPTTSYNNSAKITQEYLSAKNYKHGSIVDALKSIGINSSYSYRKKLAQKNNILNYHGSYSQNVYMLNLLKEGKLKKA